MKMGYKPRIADRILARKLSGNRINRKLILNIYL